MGSGPRSAMSPAKLRVVAISLGYVDFLCRKISCGSSFDYDFVFLGWQKRGERAVV